MAAGDVGIYSLSHKDLDTFAVGLAGGVVAVSGGDAVGSVGSSPTSTFTQGAGGIYQGAWSSTVTLPRRRRRDSSTTPHGRRREGRPERAAEHEQLRLDGEGRAPLDGGSGRAPRRSPT